MRATYEKAHRSLLLPCTVLALLLATAGDSETPPAYKDPQIKDGLAVHLVANGASVDLAAGT